MKSIALLAIMFFSAISNASLKFTFQNNFYDQGKYYRPMVGLNYYAKPLKFVGFNVWAGTSQEPFEIKEDVTWYSAKVQGDFYLGRWTISPGFQYKFIEPDSQDRGIGFVRIDYKILD